MGGRGEEVDAAVAASRRGETDKGHCDKHSGAFARARDERGRSRREQEVYTLPFFLFFFRHSEPEGHKTKR